MGICYGGSGRVTRFLERVMGWVFVGQRDCWDTYYLLNAGG